ncbi:GntR family transcriptional regulator [Kocuria sp.]|uniref:GntR family transcriptional regulator n=1 Tax=Kocuria sp. TaxID=1871328 RepID=UPI0026DF8231|nr:GntR family transcriptional regulator [Kocuria sp.]MDO5617236.1 GntR family transcriptional regulator [Kocuria sp.]
MFQINQLSTVPPFEQIKQQITAARESGELPAGHHLPPVRKLAEQLSLAPNTVARAYKELEVEGVLETRGRHGSFVTGTAESADRAAAHAARQFAAQIRRLGVDDTVAVELVKVALAAQRQS